jgi:hypothetical protein
MKKRAKIKVTEHDILYLIHWARRYCDGRKTFVPTDFNKIYDRVMADNPHLEDKDRMDVALTEDGKFFPYAQDGMYPQINALPEKKSVIKLHCSNDH